MRAIGFMTGTSLDGIDVALLETDGETISSLGPHAEYPMPKAVRNMIEASIADALKWDGEGIEPPSFMPARIAITQSHSEALVRFLRETDTDIGDIDVIGVHGQTIFHQRPKNGKVGRTIQLFDAESFARQTDKTIVFDFRSNDVASGGEGAPLAPVYHRALVRHADLKDDIVVVNLGGVANITQIGADDTLLAFDTGPANGLMDQLMRHRGVGEYDQDGALAAQGVVDNAVLQAYLHHEYFSIPAPKSLDRYDFSIDPVMGLSLVDAMATLCAFSVESLMKGITLTGRSPQTVILSGGGRLNHHLCAQITARLHPITVKNAEDLGWRGGAIEAEAFAYMAARRLKGLPVSFPTTTGVPHPMTGGRIYAPNLSFKSA
jgi:anhydro-N-acetylmuramic acid kinase